MTEIGQQIADLMMASGKTAPDMTHAVKVLGNGSMQNGFKRIGEFFEQEAATAGALGRSRGRIQGTIFGIVITIAAGSAITYYKKKRKQRAAHDAEGQIILDTLGTPASTSIPAEPSDTVPTELCETGSPTPTTPASKTDDHLPN